MENNTNEEDRQKNIKEKRVGQLVTQHERLGAHLAQEARLI